MKKKLYKDSLHGFTAYASSRNMAWMLIRGKCHELKLEVPTFDKILNEETAKRERNERAD
jgi:hypothetical protein